MRLQHISELPCLLIATALVYVAFSVGGDFQELLKRMLAKQAGASAVAASAGPAAAPMSRREGKQRADGADDKGGAGAAAAGPKRKAEVQYIWISDDEC